MSRTIGLLSFWAAISCAGKDILPTPACPTPPTAQQNLGTATPPSGRWGVVLELKSLYVARLIRSIIPNVVSKSALGSHGLDVKAIRLEQEDSATGRLNLVHLTVTLWMQGKEGEKVDLPGREYDLSLRIVPHLLSVTTGSARTALFRCNLRERCGQSGTVLSFGFHSLRGGPRRGLGQVDCKSNGYDVLDERALDVAYRISEALPPLAIPTDDLNLLLSSLARKQVNIIGLTVGTDQHLQIAFEVDHGTPRTFSADGLALMQLPDSDWGLLIDQDLVRDGIEQNARNLAATWATEMGIQATIIGTKATFSRGSITVQVSGTRSIPLCGDVPFKVELPLNVGVCSSDIAYCVGSPKAEYSPASEGQKVCSEVASFVASIAGMVRSSIVRLQSTWLGRPAFARPMNGSQCGPVLRRPPTISFAFDSLYATSLELDRMFYLEGRSRFMDAALARLPADITTCPVRKDEPVP